MKTNIICPDFDLDIAINKMVKVENGDYYKLLSPFSVDLESGEITFSSPLLNYYLENLGKLKGVEDMPNVIAERRLKAESEGDE